MNDREATTQYTPGPWSNNGGQIEAPGGFPAVIACVGEVNNQSRLDTANARLVTAAPDLLEAAKASLAAIEYAYQCHYIGPWPDTLMALKTAIAKATKPQR